MFLQSEIKDFIKNTLILTLFFTLILHLSWGYIGPILGLETSASTANSKNFQETSMKYLWNIATALSLSLGQREKTMQSVPISLSESMISISAVIANPTEWQKRLIGGNMSMIQSYANLLSTDIVSMLDRSTDRWAALDEHIKFLEDYGQDITERLLYLGEQIAELTNIVNESTAIETQAKTNLDTSFVWLDYTGVDGAIEAYTKARTADTRARIYLAYLGKFQKSYIALQIQNKKLLNVLRDNREALIKRSSVVIPSTGTDILRSLKLIETEAEYNTRISQ